MTSHATRKWGPDGSDPIPAIQDHELRIQKLEEILSFRAGNSIGKTVFTKAQMESIIATKHPVFQLPSNDELHRLRVFMEGHKLTQHLAQRIAEVQRATEEAHVRAELIRLGWIPPDEKAEDSVHPLPGSGPEIASMVKAINENPLNAMCDNDGQTESPLKESDRPTPEGLRICPDPTGEGSAWQGSTTTAEPAPGSDAEHPPVGYVLVPLTSNDPIGSEWIVWSYRGPWRSVSSENVDLQRSRSRYAMARPIPANEGDSQKAELSDKIAESVVQDLQQACYDRDELRATVEGLTEENAELRNTNRSYHMTITDLNDRLRMVREAAR